MRQQRGFVLVLTLWTLVVLTMVIGFFAAWTQEAVEIARQAQTDVEAEIDMSNTRSTLLYIMTTQRVTYGGFTLKPKAIIPVMNEGQIDIFSQDDLQPTGEEIRHDDRPYYGLGRARFAIQDKAGLIPLNNWLVDTMSTDIAGKRVLGLLAELDVPSEARLPLVAKLLDYVDLDDNHRINGAESYHYEQEGLPPPPNALLLTPLECQNILDWDNYTELWRDNRWQQLTTTMSVGLLNLNTAPKTVLNSLGMFTPAMVEAILVLRRDKPLFDPTQLNDILGRYMDSLTLFEESMRLYSSRHIRLTLWYDGGSAMQQVHIELTPNAHQSKPWQIRYQTTYPLSKQYNQDHLQHVDSQLFKSALLPATS